MNNKARHNLIDAKCRWRSDQLGGAGRFWEPLGQTQVMQIRQGAITHDFCCLSCQQIRTLKSFVIQRSAYIFKVRKRLFNLISKVLGQKLKIVFLGNFVYIWHFSIRFDAKFLRHSVLYCFQLSPFQNWMSDLEIFRSLMASLLHFSVLF